ncbi:MAG: Gfo/Idh/MocA family protein [Rhizobiaceae bacterium]
MVAIAHIGYGYWGRNIARNLAELGVLRLIADADAASAQKGAAELGVGAATLDQVLESRDIDAVTIASPAELHFDHARAALHAGKSVFVEKPLSLKVGDAEVLCAMADERGLTLMVGHLLQYHPVYVRLREMVRGGGLGRLLYVYSNRLSLGKFRREENVMWSFAPHDISMILALFGSEPSSVSAQGNVAYTAGVADVATVQMRFGDGGGAHVFASWMHPFKEHRLVVVGDRAMAVFEDSALEWESKLKLYRHVIDTSGAVPNPTKGDAETIVVERAEPLKEECRHFVDCLERGLVPRTDGREGVRVLRVLDAAETALRDDIGSSLGRRVSA